ncbi:MAG: hypothetical protein RMM51_03005 [Verrucomicrobiae bacterium]|nr:hypothetical protein [Verrucomicrobiae bacterium]
MNRPIRVAVAWLLMVLSAWASSPEEFFFESARFAGEAELAASKADWRTAVQRLEQAVSILENLRAAHPAWNPSVVEFRLRTYRQQQFEYGRLGGMENGKTAPAGRGTEPGPETQQLQANNLSLRTELDAVRAELQRTEATNAWLAARLADLSATNSLLSAFGAEVTAELHTARQRVEELQRDLAQAQAAARAAIAAAGRQQETLQVELQHLREQLESARRSPDAVATWRQNVLSAASRD